jgi:hypothetical protein
VITLVHSRSGCGGAGCWGTDASACAAALAGAGAGSPDATVCSCLKFFPVDWLVGVFAGDLAGDAVAGVGNPFVVLPWLTVPDLRPGELRDAPGSILVAVAGTARRGASCSVADLMEKANPSAITPSLCCCLDVTKLTPTWHCKEEGAQAWGAQGVQACRVQQHRCNGSKEGAIWRVQRERTYPHTHTHTHTHTHCWTGLSPLAVSHSRVRVTRLAPRLLSAV